MGLSSDLGLDDVGFGRWRWDPTSSLVGSLLIPPAISRLWKETANETNEKNAFFFFFLAQTKGLREREREGKRKGKEKGKLEVKLWQKRKNRKRPSQESNPGPGPSKRGWCSTIEPLRHATSPASLFEILSALPPLHNIGIIQCPQRKLPWKDFLPGHFLLTKLYLLQSCSVTCIIFHFLRMWLAFHLVVQTTKDRVRGSLHQDVKLVLLRGICDFSASAKASPTILVLLPSPIPLAFLVFCFIFWNSVCQDNGHFHSFKNVRSVLLVVQKTKTLVEAVREDVKVSPYEFCMLGSIEASANACVTVHTNLPPSQSVLWIELVGKATWLPLNFVYQYVICTGPNAQHHFDAIRVSQVFTKSETHQGPCDNVYIVFYTKRIIPEFPFNHIL